MPYFHFELFEHTQSVMNLLVCFLYLESEQNLDQTVERVIGCNVIPAAT